MNGDARRPIGRPLKYGSVLEALEDEMLYSPADIADLALERGFKDGDPRVNPKLLRQRIRITMGRLGHNHQFPREGDGNVTRRGQAPTPGWLGSRWKGAMLGPWEAAQ